MQDERLEACLEEALRKRPEIRVPPYFASRVLARLPATGTERHAAVPIAVVAACLLFAALGVLLVSSGEFSDVAGWLEAALRQPILLASIIAVEAVLSLAWLLGIAIKQE